MSSRKEGAKMAAVVARPRDAATTIHPRPARRGVEVERVMMMMMIPFVHEIIVGDVESKKIYISLRDVRIDQMKVLK